MIRVLAHHFILCLWQDLLLLAEGLTLRYSYCFLSERWAAIPTIRCESESHSGEEIEGLTEKVFRDCDHVQTNVGYHSRMLTPAGGCKPVGKCNLAGLIARVGSVV